MTDRKFKFQELNIEQIENFLEKAKKKLISAEKVLRIDKEIAYQTAYESMIKASLAFVLSLEKRPRALPGHHLAIIEFIQEKIDKKHRELIGLFDSMRKKRNRSIYESSAFITEYEAKESIKTAQKFIKIIEDEIYKKHPQKKLV